MARPLLHDRAFRDVALAPVEELTSAVAFLTRLPVRAEFLGRSGASAFGLVGAVAGLAGSVPLLLLGGPVPWVAAVLAVGIVALLSGALHLDGLSDTADALLAFGPVAAERARKDPAAGPAGITALVVVLGLQIACLAAIAGSAGAGPASAMLVVATSLGRTLAVVVARGHRLAAARADGSGARFAEQVTGLGTLATLATTAAIVVVAAVLTTPAVAVAAAAGGLLARLLGTVVVRWRHGLDGDGLGAIVELTVTVSLLAGAVTLAVGA